MRAWSAIAIAVALLTGINSAAMAKPKSTTQYKYYPVSGGSAVELYIAMMKRGPHVNGDQAYASTTATQTLDGRFIRTNSCRLHDINLSFQFTIRLPKLASAKGLSKTTRERWQQFSQFLRKHEETHRSIWIACAADFEKRALAVKASTCEAADAEIARLADEARIACNKKHDAFDAAEQKRVAKHPFVKQVLAPQKKQTAALAAQKPTKKKRKSIF
jgi:predicted secreted Zn-dependent protease